MSSAERFVRHHRQQTDRAISQAYRRLAANTLASATFRALLDCVRNRAPRLHDAPVVNGHHAGVEALVNLSRFTSAHVRKIDGLARELGVLATGGVVSRRSLGLHVRGAALPRGLLVRDGRRVRRKQTPVVRRPCAWCQLSIARPADRDDQEDGAPLSDVM